MLGNARSNARATTGVALAAVFLAALSLPPALRADELKLKDGTKITGVIVGFEENSFRVKTNYGYALVQKDQVVSISIADPNAEPLTTQPAAKTSKSGSLPAPAIAASVSGESAPPKIAPAKPAIVAAAKPAPSSASAPPASVTSAPIREQVSGNSYTNETYGFRMYKPPDWDVIQGARSVLPGAITAMGTADQSTYLLIGQNPVGKSLAADMDATENRLRDTLDDFRSTGEAKIIVAGLPAIERKFQGSVDNHNWSGVVVLIPHGPRLYTIFGMTLADNELVQIQENVISRAIESLQFTR